MIWIVAALLVIAGTVGALYWRWRQRVEAEIAEGAEIEWAHLQASEPALVANLDRAKFNEIYHRVHFPRFPGYVLACLGAFVASLPISFGLLAAGVAIAERFHLTPSSVELADRLLVEDGRMRLVRSATPEAAAYYVSDLAGFYYFFGVLVVWMLIVYFIMRRYHGRRPGYLRDEILRSR